MVVHGSCPRTEPVPLGLTGIGASSIGLGMASLGRPAYINLGHGHDLGGDRSVAAMKARSFEVLDAAYRAGVRYLDTAASYGRAEEFVGDWLRDRRPEGVAVGSKWGYTYTGEWSVDAEVHEVKEHSLTNFRRQVADSRRLLGRNLALHQIHSVTPDSSVLEDLEVLAALGELRDSGVAVGLTVSGARQGEVIRRSAGISVAGGPLFSVVQATWNLLEQSAAPALAEAHSRGMAVIVKEALANGRLTERGMPSVAPPTRAVLEDLAASRRTGIDALALAAAMAQPWAAVVLSGASSTAQLCSNLRAGSVLLDPRALGRLEALGEEPASYWQGRAKLPWT